MPERKVEVGRADAYGPKEKIDGFLKDIEYPFALSIKNVLKNKALLLPGAKQAGVIAAGATVEVQVNSYQQAWDIFMDAASAAEVRGFDKVVVLSLEVPAKAPKSTGEPK